jgi:bacteriocin-like protein
MEKIMSKTNVTDKTRELTEDELNLVYGGKGADRSPYMEIKLNEAFISAVVISPPT